jgi:tetratricopeptide (TPR) repeat protein
MSGRCCEILAGLVLLALVPVSTAAEADLRVERIFDDGLEVTKIELGSKAKLRTPSGQFETQPLLKGQVLVPGTRLSAARSVSIELLRTDPLLRIRLEPGTELTIVRNDDSGAAADVGEGRATFSLFRNFSPSRLDFFFGVSSFKRVLALARGTQFAVTASRTCAGSSDAPCVTLQLDEGRLAIETRRPLRLGSVTVPPADVGEDSTVLQTDPMGAGDSRTLSLAPEQFALRFDSPQSAENHYRAQLEHARTAGDVSAVLPALRNLLVVYRVTGRVESELTLAEDGLALADREGDRVWQFRFLIDKAFAMWRLRRDASALPLFERAFAMTDALGAANARTDLASLYGRYSSLRFETRDRAKPQSDLDVAEDYARRALQLREPAPGEPPTLDLAMSLYGLGTMLRIGREDAAQSYRYLSRALDIRHEVLQGRDNLATAETMSEAALSLESVLSKPPLACPAPGEIPVFAPVQTLFDNSLAMLERLSPNTPLRSNAAVARRSADFHRRLGDWLGDTCHQAELASGAWQRARIDYENSLRAWSAQRSNTSAERRFAWRGLGMVQLRLANWGAASAAVQQAYALAIDERCSATPSAEAPSFSWIADLVDLLAQSADGESESNKAEAHRREASMWRIAPTCPAPGKARPAQ